MASRLKPTTQRILKTAAVGRLGSRASRRAYAGTLRELRRRPAGKTAVRNIYTYNRDYSTGNAKPFSF